MARDKRVNYDITATDKTKQAVDSVKRNLGEVNSAVTGLKSGFLAIAPALASIGLLRFGKDALDTADNLSKLSQRVGVSVESLSTLRYGAQLSGVSIEELGQGLKKLSVNMLDTQAGTGEARDAFAALGIEVTDARGRLRSSEDVMLDLAERFAGMKDRADKTAYAVKLFGRAGAELIPFLNQGRDGISALTREAERLGLKLDAATAQAAERFNDNMAALGFAAKGAAQAMVNPLLPVLNDIAEAMKRGAMEGGVLKGVFAGLSESALQLSKSLIGDSARAQLGEIDKAIALKTAQLEKAESFRAGGGVDRGRVERLSRDLAELFRRRTVVEGMLDFETPGGLGAQTPPAKKGAPKYQSTEQRNKARAEMEKIAKLQADAEEEFAKESAEAWRYWADYEQREREKDFAADTARMQAWYDWIDREQEEAIEAGRILIENSVSETEKITRKATDVAKEFGLVFKSALEDVILEGGKARDVIRALIQDMARIALRKTVTEPLLGGLGKILEGVDLFGSGPTPVQLSGPFAHGGGFRVAGAGGTDSQLVAFRATPGETVSVQTPGQAGGGRGVTIVQNIHIDARSDFAAIVAAMEQAKALALGEVADLLQRGERGMQYAGAR